MKQLTCPSVCAKPPAVFALAVPGDLLETSAWRRMPGSGIQGLLTAAPCARTACLCEQLAEGLGRGL